jgi:hypothetical protein
MFTIKKKLVILAVIMLLIPGVQVVMARANPGILPPNSHPHGKTLAEWGAQVLKAQYEMPASINPFSSDTGNHCAVQLVGHMALLWTNPFNPEPYSCSVPPGTMVVTPAAMVWCDSNLDQLDTEEELRQCANDWYGVTGLQGSFDGVELTDLDQYLVTTAATSYTMPADSDNIFGLPWGTTGQFVGKGTFVILAPLPVGEHTLHFQGYYTNYGLMEDFTLILTVTP